MGWSLVTSWSWSTNVSEVVFTGLGSYSEIMVLARSLTCSASVVRGIQVSADGGSTYYSTSGDYKTIDANGSETSQTSVPLHETNATAARSGLAMITAWNLAQKKPWKGLNLTNIARLFDQAAALDALRVFPASGNLTGGSILVFGR